MKDNENKKSIFDFLKNNDEKFNVRAVNIILYLIIIVIVLYLFTQFNLLVTIKEILVSLLPFYLGFFIAWMMRPLAASLSKRLHIKQSISNFIAILINLFIIVLIVFVVLPLALIQLATLVQDSADIYQGLKENLAVFNIRFDTEMLTSLYEDYIKQYVPALSAGNILKALNVAADIGAYLIGTVYGIVNFFTQIILAYIIAFYFIADITRFSKRLIELIFSTRAQKFQETSVEISRTLFGYFRGLVIICTFIGIFVGIGCKIIGLPSPVLFGLVAGLTNVIPYLGPILGGIPIMLVALSISFKTFLVSLIVVFGAQFIESNFLQPRIMSKNVNLHPVTIICGLIVFGQLFGIFGMILATPILSILNVILKHSSYNIHL